MSKRRQNFQNISWFLDLYNRKLLDLDPPFQRRSVWNDKYREDFIDTILLDYPAPAIFLFGKMDEHGNATYQVVDGKQRLTSIFRFADNSFPVSEASKIDAFRGLSFHQLPHDTKIGFFNYDFSVEYLPTNNEQVINDIFDRLNRNTAKLTAQELRHAKYSGQFIAQAESLSDWMRGRFERPFPRIPESSQRQMKDVEIVASLLLLLEEGPHGYSTLELDAAFASRDSEWEDGSRIVEEFRRVIDKLADLVQHVDGEFLTRSRLRNQADFYSLFGAVAELARESQMPENLAVVGRRLQVFLETVEEDGTRDAIKWAAEYYNAARSASNDQGSRQTRISVLKKAIIGELPLNVSG